MRWRLDCLTIVFLSLCCSTCGAQRSGRVLALFDVDKSAEDYSHFLSDVEALGFSVEAKQVTDGGLHLRSWDEWLYDKLIIISSGNKPYGGALDNEAILDFVEAGKGLVVAADSRISDDLRSLASDLGVDFEPKGSAVLDPFNHVIEPESDGSQVIVSSQIAEEAYILGPTRLQEPILFKGVGSTCSPHSRQVTQVLGAELSQHMNQPGQAFTEELQAIGKAISLVTVTQTLNDARVLLSGSQDLFSNAFYDAKDIRTADGQSYPASGNRAFVKELITWTFGERSVLRASNLKHRTANSSETPAMYRITDYIDFEVEIKEYSQGQWKPFKASDVQLEFTMLDPHIRTFLQHDGRGRYFTTFKIPDVYGVFKFVIDYQRKGLTHLEVSEQVSVRHFKHNEFQRFIVSAYPYYVSAFSCMFAFWIFGFVFLYSR